MKTIEAGKEYLLHWQDNPAVWNEDLKNLKKHNVVIYVNDDYYTIVYPHYTGEFDIVDCDCDNKGNYYPINTENLKRYYNNKS